MVVGLLTMLTLSVLQLALALHVRNTVLDAAAEGARYASLAGNGLGSGAARTRDLIGTAIGDGYARDVSAEYVELGGWRAAEITVRTPLPLIGLLGVEQGLEVRGHAVVESLDEE
jgi:hypothetical protein